MERHDPGDLENISAYAKLEFDQFSFFIQTLTLIVGRKARREDNVDVHLGVSKSISRVHAKIFYQFDAMSWEIEVLGKNGAFINEKYVQAGDKSALRSTDKLLIGDAHFVFLLPDGATAPLPSSQLNAAPLSTRLSNVPATPRPFNPLGNIPPSRTMTNGTLSATPLAPHHLMASPSTTLPKVATNSTVQPSTSVAIPKSSANAEVRLHTSTVRAYLTTPQNQADYSSTSTIPQHKIVKPDGSIHFQETGSKDDKPISSTKSEIVQTKAEPSWSHSLQSNSLAQPAVSEQDKIESLESQAKTEEERRLQEEEAAAQHAAQLLHQERLARQAREEEEGLILPPAETDPAIIAALQKPSASYATMIYNAIASHEKKKMTLAQIYSWICINHPYYRYVQNGWQNSIRHNLSLNKAFMKVPRTDDEPGKGSFWAVDPDSEMLFEGGVYKKKPPRPMPSAPLSRGAPVVMKDGKLALNPNFFLGGISGKAEEVLQMLQAAVQKQLGYGNEPEQASQIARILALALATQLRQAAVASSTPRHQQVQMLNRPVSVSSPPSLPRYPATPAPSAYRASTMQPIPRASQSNGTLGLGTSGTTSSTVRVPTTATLANTAAKHPYVGSPYAINANSSIAASKIPQVNSLPTAGQSAANSMAIGVSHAVVKPITNPVYYKPYSVASAPSQVLKPGLPNTMASKTPLGVVQNHKTSQPSRSDQGTSTKSIPPVGSTLSHVYSTKPSIGPESSKPLPSHNQSSASMSHQASVIQKSDTNQAFTKASIPTPQPNAAIIAAHSSKTNSTTGQIERSLSSTHPTIDQHIPSSTAQLKLVQETQPGTSASSSSTKSAGTETVKIVEASPAANVKPSEASSTKVEVPDTRTIGAIGEAQSQARNAELILEPAGFTTTTAGIVATRDGVESTTNHTVKPEEFVTAPSTKSIPSVPTDNSSSFVGGNNKRSSDADAETSVSKLQKVDAKLSTEADVKDSGIDK